MTEGATAEKRMKIATVYIGYADGLPQHIKDGTAVKVNNQDATVFGKVSMDVTTIDVTDIKECKMWEIGVSFFHQIILLIILPQLIV